MRIEFIFRILIAIVIVALSSICSGSTLDPTIGSNWYIPTSTIRSNSAIQAISGRADSNGVAQPHYNYRTVSGESSSSSFVPTTAHAARHQAVPSNGGATVGETAKFYYQAVGGGDGSGKQFNHYYQYQPDGNSYAVFPTSASGDAEQRQEFLDPNGGNFLPLQGPGDFGGEDGGGGFLSNLPSFGGITSGITGTANNIAQAVGLGSLGLVGGLIVLAIGGPLVVFAIIFPIIILIVAILGFPVLQLTLPPTDPNLNRKLKVGLMETAKKAKEVLQSEECVERLSCGLARKSRKLPYENWILQKMDNTTNVWANRVSTSVKTGRAGEDCNRFKCTVAVKLKELYDVVLRK